MDGLKYRCAEAKIAKNTGVQALKSRKKIQVLHGMLTKPPIALVGLSNWVLDAAKMNRAICLLRPDPTPADLRHTGEAPVKKEKEKEHLGTPVFYAILVPTHLYFSRCASSRVPLAISRFFAIFSRFS